MEKAVLTVFGRHESEKVIEKSRFIAYSEHVESEEEAKNFLSEIRSKHTLATHCCYAFIADKTGNLMRFSDDGEPQGTAGMPILDVLKNKKLTETAVAVVRYFGGIKLGAGGARARVFLRGVREPCGCGYSRGGNVQRIRNPCGLLRSGFCTEIHFVGAVPAAF